MNDTYTMVFTAIQETIAGPEGDHWDIETGWAYTNTDPLVVRITVPSSTYIISREFLAKGMNGGGLVKIHDTLDAWIAHVGEREWLYFGDYSEPDGSVVFIRFPWEMAEEFYAATTEIVVPGEEGPVLRAAIEDGLKQLLKETT